MKLKEFSCLLLLLNMSILYGQSILSGKVIDEEKQPIAKAEVYINEIQTMEVTNAEGAFQFDNIPPNTYKITVFSFEYEVFVGEITVSEANSSIEIILKPFQTNTLSEVIVSQRREQVFELQKLKTVEGTAVFAGKKSEVVLVENKIANLAANNARQIYNQVVGLNIYDNGDAGLQLNIGGRGLDPNRTANFNVRQNGYDISADALGYPESYYTPPAEALSEIQVVRGAASLQYGPQFGGLINFKLKQPNPNKKLELISRQTLGSFDLFTSFNSLSGTVGKFSYYTYFNYKEGNGFRPNSAFNSRNYFGNFNYQLSDKTKLGFETTFFNYLAQQPGGLNDIQFMENPEFSNRERNWFNVDWQMHTLKLMHAFSPKTDFSWYISHLNASRSAIGLRTNRIDAVDNPEDPRELLVDDFKNWSSEARLLTRYNLGEQDAVLLLGAKYYESDNSQQQGPGSAGFAADFSFRNQEFPDYDPQAAFVFPNRNLSLFGEHVFRFSNTFSITPGFRFEYIKTESEGNFKRVIRDLAGNVLVNEELPFDRTFERNFFLFGAGLSYKPTNSLEVYANFSENYRAVTFSDIRVVNPSNRIDENITDETGYTADLGIRGRIKEVLNYDLSAFSLLYDNRIGEIVDPEDGVGTLRGNIGTAQIFGLESFVDFNLGALFRLKKDSFKWNYFVNFALTTSEYTDSDQNNVAGKEVEFIPRTNLKTGLSFGYKNFLSSLQYTSIAKQFTDATNSEALLEDARNAGIIGSIPAYDILDFSIAYTYKKFRLETGINNVLDNAYFTRRATGYPGPGIIPSEPRTFYATLQIKL